MSPLKASLCSVSIFRVTWWRWALIKATYRSGMPQQERSSLF